MSGGSYNFLFRRLEHADLGADAGRMAERLRAAGYPDAADAVTRLFEAPPTLLEVMQAVEWADSGDWNDGDVADAVEAWRAAGGPGGPPAPVAVTKGDVIRIVPDKGQQRSMTVAHVEHYLITLADPA